MMKFEFKATGADFSSSSSKIVSVLLYNEEEERVVSLHCDKKIPDSSYIERDDQTYGTYGGVEKIKLYPNKLQIKLTSEGNKALKCKEIIVHFQLDDNEVNQLRKNLELIHKDRLVLDKYFSVAQSNKKKVKPKKDYSKFERLRLENEKINNLPEYVSGMTSLQKVALIDNPNLNLDKALKILSKLQCIKELDISTPNDVPSSIGLLTNLEKLCITNITEKHIPSEIGELKKLCYLLLMTNGELHLPKEIVQLSNLQSLNVSAAKWDLPNDFGKFSKLESLTLSNCDIERLPADFHQLENLHDLSITNNPKIDWADTFEKLSRLKSLTSLLLYTDSSIIPAQIGLCTQIRSLRFLTGYKEDNPLKLPPTIGDMINLEVLDMGGNFLAELPETIGNLKSLRLLNISGCNLNHLPETIAQLKSLKLVALNGTKIKEPLSKGVEELILSISNNKLIWTEQGWDVKV